MATLSPYPPLDVQRAPPPPTLAQLRGLPGASTYRLANAAILKMRKALSLKEAFELLFNNWGPGNEVFDWYTGLPNKNIHTIHLRKERKSPFYHEYITFRLRDDTYWRIDRRQLQDEPTPINCIYEPGVPAHDTIIQTTGLGSSIGLDPLLGPASDCMIELEFKKDVDVGLVLRICRAIKFHEKAMFYTLQRYNCFFFAQTIIMCTACGASNWGGWSDSTKGNDGQEGPWKSPNAPLDKKWSILNNADHAVKFSWKPTESFSQDWGALSQQSNALVQTSPLLRHADHCNYCVESQSVHRQRSMSSEINRLKHELVEYWNKEYRELLDQAYLTNHAKFVESGLWRIIAPNTSETDCKRMLEEKLVDIRAKWDQHSEKRLVELLATVHNLLDPAEVCDAWYPDPDEWKATWTCKDGGPVKAALEKWERDVQSFIKGKFNQLKGELETQTIQRSTQVHAAAMQKRVESFGQVMTIRLRGLDENEFLKPTQQLDGDVDQSESVMSPERKSVFSGRTLGTFVSKMTKRATKIKHRMRRLFKGSNQLDEVQIALLERRIGVFITKHGDNVQTYKAWLKCTSAAVEEDMKQAMDDVWHEVTGLRHLLAKDGVPVKKLTSID